MRPNRKEIINGKLIEEFYWNSRCIVYVNNKLIHGKSFDEICKEEWAIADVVIGC